MGRGFLPPGLRFHPTDVELVQYYLKRKVMGKKLHFEAISEVDMYKFPPWDLPAKACLRSRDLEWYFFCPRDRKYGTGQRVNRSTGVGYWKTTGKDKPVYYDSRAVAMRKTLIFHIGKAPSGERTDWVVHEYRLEDNQLADVGIHQKYVLCKLFQKSGRGPRNGEQRGAPFVEEDWEDDAETDGCQFASSFLLGNQPSVVDNPSQGIQNSQLGNMERIMEDTCIETEKPIETEDIQTEGIQEVVPLGMDDRIIPDIPSQAEGSIQNDSEVPVDDDPIVRLLYETLADENDPQVLPSGTGASTSEDLDPTIGRRIPASRSEDIFSDLEPLFPSQEPQPTAIAADPSSSNMAWIQYPVPNLANPCFMNLDLKWEMTLLDLDRDPGLNNDGDGYVEINDLWQ